MGNVDLEALFDEIISKTEQREAFSEGKEKNIGFSAIEDMRKLRDEFIASETELELYFALVKLSNVRRDGHLAVGTVDRGLPGPERRPCVAAPIYVLPEITDVHNPTFFVSAVGEGVTSPERGDVIVGVNGSSMEEYIDEFAPWISHSTLPGLYWRMASPLPRPVFRTAVELVFGTALSHPRAAVGGAYDVSLNYGDGCSGFSDPGVQLTLTPGSLRSWSGETSMSWSMRVGNSGTSMVGLRKWTTWHWSRTSMP